MDDSEELVQKRRAAQEARAVAAAEEFFEYATNVPAAHRELGRAYGYLLRRAARYGIAPEREATSGERRYRSQWWACVQRAAELAAADFDRFFPDEAPGRWSAPRPGGWDPMIDPGHVMLVVLECRDRFDGHTQGVGPEGFTSL